MPINYSGTTAHTDGSKKGHCSCAVALIICNGKFISELHRRTDGRTSSGVELAGVLEAARFFKQHMGKLYAPFRIYTDNLEVVTNYAKRKEFKPKTYKDDWAELFLLGDALNIEISHIKGHSAENEINPNKVCDALAKTICGMDLFRGSAF